MVDINFLWLFGKSPSMSDAIMNPHPAEASEIYSADGKLIGKFFSENRTPVTYEDVTPSSGMHSLTQRTSVSTITSASTSRLSLPP